MIWNKGKEWSNLTVAMQMKYFKIFLEKIIVLEGFVHDKSVSSSIMEKNDGKRYDCL